MFTLLKPRALFRPQWVTGSLSMSQLTSTHIHKDTFDTMVRIEHVQKSLRLNSGKWTCRFPECQLAGSGLDMTSIYPIRAPRLFDFMSGSIDTPHLHDMRIVTGAESMKFPMRRSPIPQDRLISANPALGACCTRHVIGAILFGIQLEDAFIPRQHRSC